MNTAALLPFLSCCLLLAAGENTSDTWRNTTSELTLNNGLAWGLWGPMEYCEVGSFAHAFEIKYERYSTTDNTAVNAVKLYCGTPEDHDTGYVTSVEGVYGEWQGMRICETGFLTGMRANVLEEQGIFHDDVAVENVQMHCGNETLNGVETADKVPTGKWSQWSYCPTDSYVCGIMVRYEDPVITADDAGTSDIIMYCCNF